MAEKHQRSDNKPKLNKDGYNWGRLRRITNDKLEKNMPIFSRSFACDVAPLSISVFVWWFLKAMMNFNRRDMKALSFSHLLMTIITVSSLLLIFNLVYLHTPMHDPTLYLN